MLRLSLPDAADGAVVHLWDCCDAIATQERTRSGGILVNGASGECLKTSGR